MTSEVSPEVRGCVKVPLWQFTPLLGDDDLMQPPWPVWHDQCCYLPAAPKGHTSISNPGHTKPTKSTLQAESMSRRRGDTNRVKWESLRTEKLLCFIACISVGVRHPGGAAMTQRMCYNCMNQWGFWEEEIVGSCVFVLLSNFTASVSRNMIICRWIDNSSLACTDIHHVPPTTSKSFTETSAKSSCSYSVLKWCLYIWYILTYPKKIK